MSNFISAYNGFLANWSDFFLTNSVEILFLAIPAAIFSLLFRNKSPRFHYILWTIVLLKSLIPSDIIKLPSNEIYMIQMPAVYSTIYAEKIQPTLNMHQNILFVIWMGIASLLLIKLVANSISFRNILRSKHQIQSDIVDRLSARYEIKQAVQVFEANIDVPFTIGFLSPKIFLPKNSDLDKIEFIIAHEMAHIKRKDFLIILIQNIITIAFFFHPIVLIASGFLNYYREIICDDMAMEAINSTPTNYGRKIIDYLEFCLKQKKYPILANGLIFSRKIFIRRIHYLLNRKEGVISKLSKVQVFLIMTLVGVLLYIIACESVTKPNFQEPIDIETKTMTVMGSEFSPDSVLINVNLEKSNPDYTILKESKNSAVNEEAIKSVKHPDFLDNLRKENIDNININVVFEKTPANYNSKVKFVPYDEAPEPIGGFAAIQKNVVYPAFAQEAGIEGTVVVQCYIDENGDADDFNIMKGLPNTGLDEAAIAAIMKTKFKPAIHENKTVGVWISIPVVFRLQPTIKVEDNVPFENKKKFDNTKNFDIVPLRQEKNDQHKMQQGLNIQDENLEKMIDQTTLKIKITETQNDQNKLSFQKQEFQTQKSVKITNSQEVKTPKERPKFIPYDQAPEPIGGFAAIQRRVVYPEIAQQAGIEGTVIVQVFVNKNGDVEICNVLKGVPNTGLDEAAVDAVKKQKFIPAKQRDKTVGVWISIPVKFKL